MRRNILLAPFLFALVAFVGLGSVVACIGLLSGGCVTTSARQASAERNAKAFADALRWEVSGLVCSGSDSEMDGYSSCTLSLKGGEIKSVLCGYDVQVALLGQNTGCKVATPISVQQQ